MASYTRVAAAAIGAGAGVVLLRAAQARARRKKLAGRVVLITGGSRGLGLALARECARLQCLVAICARDKAELEAARKTFGNGGRAIFAVPCDVSDKLAVDAMIEVVIRHYGCIDILVNNAGEITVSPFENLEIADFERAMAVMFWGTVYTTLAVLPSMRARRQGRIVNVTSIGGKVSVPHLLSYGCAKAAAVAFGNGLRHEVRQFGIDVTTIIPGLMRTGSYVNAFFKGDRAAEASWFGAAASLPLLSLSPEHAAQLIIKAICKGQAESVLGTPAQILLQAYSLVPGVTADVLRLGNALLPKGSADPSFRTGSDLEDQHGSFYYLLTYLGRRAGERLNQPV